MNITEHKLTITDELRTKTLIYRGNENVMITCNCAENEDDSVILFPRHILEKFMEIIES